MPTYFENTPSAVCSDLRMLMARSVYDVNTILMVLHVTYAVQYVTQYSAVRDGVDAVTHSAIQ